MIRKMLAAVAMMSLMACDQLRQDAAGGDTVVGRNLELASGATISVTLDQTITSRSNAAGETVMTTVEADVRDEAGRVVIPAGATVELAIVEIEPAGSRRQADGTLTLRVAGVTIGGQQYPLDAGVTSVAHTLEGRGVTAGEVEKVAAGALIGAVAGRVIGGNAKGTIIGGAVGAAAGATVAIETASRDVVVTAGTPMVLTLNGPLTVAVR